MSKAAPGNKNIGIKLKNKVNRFIFDKEGFAPIFEHVNGAVSLFFDKKAFEYVFNHI